MLDAEDCRTGGVGEIQIEHVRVEDVIDVLAKRRPFDPNGLTRPEWALRLFKKGIFGDLGWPSVLEITKAAASGGNFPNTRECLEQIISDIIAEEGY